ncbi:MAG: tetratricopeptide repeat protein [Pedosphaera sp.]|nr:tetratricopeptide repeat protein [Pedosphaera sp.]
MPEKSSSAVSGRAREFWDRGIAALQKQNYDYAIEMFSQSLVAEPGFYDCRQELRKAQFKKAGRPGSGGFFKKMLGTAGHSPAFAKAQIALRSNPVEAISIVEQILNSDPANIAAHKLLADAALASDLPRTAILSLEIAFKHAPQDRQLAERLAATLAQQGQIARAELIYADLLRAFPTDQELAQTLKNVTANRTMSEGGYDTVATGQGSYRDILKDKAEALSLEQQHRQVKSDDVTLKLIREQEALLAADPRNTALLRSIAELHLNRDDYDRAIECFQKILEIEGTSDPMLEKAIADARVRKLNLQITSLDRSNPGSSADITKLEVEKSSYQLAECQKRAERYPHDLQIAFELAMLYFQAGRITEAIKEFQRAQNNPHRRIAAMSHLGQCFAKRGMNDLAARRFQEAIKEKIVFDDEKKDLIYWLGTVLEKMGKPEEAIEQFKQIYETDIGYRDVAVKVDAYYESR